MQKKGGVAIFLQHLDETQTINPNKREE
jgi:hypothetical protein